MDRFYLMQTFVAVVDCQGFAGASRKLNVSPPAVTRAIAELEERLGVRLLARTTRVVRPTDAGALYVEDCRRILAEVEEADAGATGAHATPRGHLTVTAPVLFGRMYVAPLVTEYLRAHADITASCWFVDRVVNMVDEGVDVAVRIGRLPDSSLHALKVGKVRQVVCASPKYLAAHAAITHPAQLADHAIVSTSAVTPTAEWRFSGDPEAQVVRITPRVTTTTNDSAMAMALEGFGLTRLMSYQAAPYIEDGRLRAVLQSFELPPVPVHLVYREGRRASKKVRAFIDLAATALAANRAIA
jgi:DNA-binding transcriptional LysR family regulator